MPIEFTVDEIERFAARYRYNNANDASVGLGRLLIYTRRTMGVDDICVTYCVVIAHKNMLFDLNQRTQTDLLDCAKTWFDYVNTSEEVTDPQWKKDLCLNYLREIIEHFEPDESTDMDL